MKDTEIYDLQSSKEVQINFEKKTITYSKRGEIKYYVVAAGTREVYFGHE